MDIIDSKHFETSKHCQTLFAGQTSVAIVAWWMCLSHLQTRPTSSHVKCCSVFFNVFHPRQVAEITWHSTTALLPSVPVAADGLPREPQASACTSPRGWGDVNFDGQLCWYYMILSLLYHLAKFPQSELCHTFMIFDVGRAFITHQSVHTLDLLWTHFGPSAISISRSRLFRHFCSRPSHFLFFRASAPVKPSSSMLSKSSWPPQHQQSVSMRLCEIYLKLIEILHPIPSSWNFSRILKIYSSHFEYSIEKPQIEGLSKPVSNFINFGYTCALSWICTCAVFMFCPATHWFVLWNLNGLGLSSIIQEIWALLQQNPIYNPSPTLPRVAIVE